MIDLANNPSWIVPDWEAPSWVVALTTTRGGVPSNGAFTDFNLADHVGDDAHKVEGNRRMLARQLDAGLRFQWLEQVHGTEVVRVVQPEAPIRADALVTTSSGLACCVLTADCLPVFFADRRGRAVAVAHAGWRGLAAGILEQTVAAFPVPADEILVWLGPAIGPCHFEVGGEVRQAFLDSAAMHLTESLADCFQAASGSGKYLADLYRLARIKLASLGVTAIGGGGHCTYCQADQFYSYRREQTTGRMASLIYLRNP